MKENLLLPNRGWRDDFNRVVPFEVSPIQGENPLHSVHFHRRDQMRVMGLLSRNAVLDDEALPDFRYRGCIGGCIGQQAKEPANADNFTLRLRDRQAQAVVVDRPRCDGPEFNEVLRRDAENFISQAKRGERGFDHPIMRVVGIQRT